MMVGDIRLPLANESTMKEIIRVNTRKWSKLTRFRGGEKLIDELQGGEKFVFIQIQYLMIQMHS